MNDIEEIVSTCASTPYCQKCQYYSHNTGDCAFTGRPKAWEMKAIEKLFESEKTLKKYLQNKRRKKAE